MTALSSDQDDGKSRDISDTMTDRNLLSEEQTVSEKGENLENGFLLVKNNEAETSNGVNVLDNSRGKSSENLFNNVKSKRHISRCSAINYNCTETLSTPKPIGEDISDSLQSLKAESIAAGDTEVADNKSRNILSMGKASSIAHKDLIRKQFLFDNSAQNLSPTSSLSDLVMKDTDDPEFSVNFNDITNREIRRSGIKKKIFKEQKPSDTILKNTVEVKSQYSLISSKPNIAGNSFTDTNSQDSLNEKDILLKENNNSLESAESMDSVDESIQSPSEIRSESTKAAKDSIPSSPVKISGEYLNFSENCPLSPEKLPGDCINFAEQTPLSHIKLSEGRTDFTDDSSLSSVEIPQESFILAEDSPAPPVRIIGESIRHTEDSPPPPARIPRESVEFKEDLTSLPVKIPGESIKFSNDQYSEPLKIPGESCSINTDKPCSSSVKVPGGSSSNVRENLLESDNSFDSIDGAASLPLQMPVISSIDEKSSFDLPSSNEHRSATPSTQPFKLPSLPNLFEMQEDSAQFPNALNVQRRLDEARNFELGPRSSNSSDGSNSDTESQQASTSHSGTKKVYNNPLECLNSVDIFKHVFDC